MAPTLEQLSIASPCPMTWEQLEPTGIDHVRHCAGCDQRVYNLSALARREVERLIADTPDLCVRFFQRADGTIKLADCTVAARPPRTTTRLAITTAAAGLAAAFAISVEPHEAPPDDHGHEGPVMGGPEFLISSEPETPVEGSLDSSLIARDLVWTRVLAAQCHPELRLHELRPRFVRGRSSEHALIARRPRTTVHTRIVIGPDGGVADAEILEAPDNATGACVLDTLHGTRFPPSEVGRRIRTTFKL